MTCGSVSDGCGGLLSCGTCPAGDVCGAGHVCETDPRRCSKCPPGFTCNARFACAEGPLKALVLDETTVSVQGALTVRGAPVTVSPNVPVRPPASIGHLAFVRAGRARAEGVFSLSRASVGGGGAFRASVPVGTYVVRARDTAGYTNLPTDLAATPEVNVPGPVTDVAVDVADEMATVGGRVTIDGAVSPMAAQCPVAEALYEITFTELVGLRRWVTTIGCDSPGFGYALRLPVGAYLRSVKLGPGGVRAGLPLGAGSVPAGLATVLPMSGGVFDFALSSSPDRFQLDGQVTVDGATPLPAGEPCMGMGLAQVRLVSQAGVTQVIPLECNAGVLAFAAPVRPGTYSVFVEPVTAGRTVGRLFPFAVRLPTVVVSGHASLALDVRTVPFAGRATVDGQSWPTSGWCTANPTAEVFGLALESLLDGFTLTIPVRCDSPGLAYRGQVPPGVYRVRYVPSDGAQRTGSGFPVVSMLLASTVAIPSAGFVDFDLQSHPVAGRVTLSGATPGAGDCVQETMAVSFLDRATGARGRVVMPCGTTDFGFEARLPTGTYEVGILNQASKALGAEQPIASPLVVDGPRAGVVLDEAPVDVPDASVAIAGNFTVNGVGPFESGRYCEFGTSGGANGTMGGQMVYVFQDLGRGVTWRATNSCHNGPRNFDVVLPPGIYQVRLASIAYEPASSPPFEGVFVERLEVK